MLVTLALLMGLNAAPLASSAFRGVANGFGYEATDEEASRAMAQVSPLTAVRTAVAEAASWWVSGEPPSHS